ncbi:MFS transporter [Rhodococcus triatomae]|nr:MFS transporter [Rhodococcus triatomae]QNG21430.1 MFS transporter [Rhodococcus triatomae]QNG25830.1 MFS transporter [Rhodococcus triatomae]
MGTGKLVVHVFVPSAFLGIGTGASAPVLPLSALGHGASVAVAGLVLALGGLGMVLGDLPAGRLVSVLGERRSVLLGTGLGVVGALLCLFSWSVASLAAGILVVGLAGALWGLARQSYLAAAVPVHRRARAISTMAGMHRLGFFAGPFAGAAAIHVSGLSAAYLVQLLAILVAGVLMGTLRDLPDPDRDPGAATRSVRTVLSAHRRILGTLGAGALTMGMLRASRNVVLPLWANHVGVDPAGIALIFGAAGAIDVLASYPAGYLMDRFGRRFMAVPAITVLGAAHAALPFTTTAAGVGAVALVLGLGSGMSNGVIMTLGADVAPSDTRAQFLAGWRLAHDTGMCLGPAGIGLLGGVATLGVACVTMGGVAFLGAGILWRYIPRYVPWPPPRPALPTPGGA